MSEILSPEKKVPNVVPLSLKLSESDRRIIIYWLTGGCAYFFSSRLKSAQTLCRHFFFIKNHDSLLTVFGKRGDACQTLSNCIANATHHLAAAKLVIFSPYSVTCSQRIFLVEPISMVMVMVFKKL